MCPQQILLRCNAKIADAFACVELEDMEDVPLLNCSQVTDSTLSQGEGKNELNEQLLSVGLSGLDINSCDVLKVVGNIIWTLFCSLGIFSPTITLIHLTESRPCRLSYRSVSLSHYQVLRKILSEIEMRDIIQKSTGKPLVLIWKKNRDLHICTDFRWLNKRTSTGAYPLPLQSDCLAALGGNCLFRTMDLTSGFYNMPLHHDDRKCSAFTTPMWLYEYNFLPQGIRNSPSGFMRMMTPIFGGQNFLSLLC